MERLKFWWRLFAARVGERLRARFSPAHYPPVAPTRPAPNRRDRRAAARHARRERVAPIRRKHEARGRRAYLRAMSARYAEV